MSRRVNLRTILILAAGLAGLKVWASDRYHRTIYHEALITAYGEKARATCQREAGRIGRAYATLRLNAADVVIGSPDTRVALWDIDNPLWEVRYRHPHLLFTAEPVSPLRCAFDVTAGLARVDEALATH